MALISDPDYARAVAGAALMSSVGGAAARPDSHAPRLSDTYASAWPDPAAACPDADTEHANRDLQAVANRREAVGRGQRDVGTMADARGDGVSEVLRARGESVRGEAGSERQCTMTMTPRDVADARTHQPLSRVPDLIDEIRRERNDLRLQVQWMRERIKTLEDQIVRMKRGYE